MCVERETLLPAFEKNDAAVVLFGDDYYVPYMGVLIQSIIDHADSKRNYDIVILERNISGPNKELIKTLGKLEENISIRFHNPSYLFETLDLAFFERDSVYPLELYYKILTPYILKNHTRLVTLDSDTLLKRDIADLYDIDLGEACVGSTRNIVFRSHLKANKMLTKNREPVMPIKEYCQKFLPMKDPYRYVNGGVLLIDCEKYREHISLENFFNVIQSKRFLFPELDPLNLVFEEKIKVIDSAWNVWPLLNPHLEKALSSAIAEDRQIYLSARENPFLIHWAGRPKPWVCPDVELGYEWWNTAMRTPFVGHIIVRMVDALEKRKEYYKTRYGKEVPVWNPVPGGINRNSDEKIP